MMQLQRRTKAGYTLVEVLIVVSIMGILASMGVAGLQDAVANSRIKDAAVNTAAFLERVGNLSRQQSEIICLAIDPDEQVLRAIKSTGADCAKASKNGGTVDLIRIDAPTRFVENKSGTCNFVGYDLTTYTNAVFKPKIGLSAVPQGVVCIQYGDDMLFGIARKTSGANSVKAFWKIGNDNGADGWLGL